MKEFDEWFKSPGLAKRIRDSKKIGEGKAAPAGVSGKNTDSGIIPDVNAAEAAPEKSTKLERKKYDRSGIKKRKESTK